MTIPELCLLCSAFFVLGFASSYLVLNPREKSMKIYHVFFRYQEGDVYETFKHLATKPTKESAIEFANTMPEGKYDVREGVRQEEENWEAGYWYLVEEAELG